MKLFELLSAQGYMFIEHKARIQESTHIASESTDDHSSQIHVPTAIYTG